MGRLDFTGVEPAADSLVVAIRSGLDASGVDILDADGNSSTQERPGTANRSLHLFGRSTPTGRVATHSFPDQADCP